MVSSRQLATADDHMRAKSANELQQMTFKRIHQKTAINRETIEFDNKENSFDENTFGNTSKPMSPRILTKT